jgi:DNA polymerase-3 subunit alpha
MKHLTEQEAEDTYPGPREFCHLHNHTLFSILDGVAQPEAYFKGCADRKWPAFAITEHGVMNSIPDAYYAAKEHKVKMIAGCEIYYNDFELIRREFVAGGSKLKNLKESDPDLESRMRRNRHLTVLCKNMQGYENLLKINRHAYENGFYYKPRVWFDNLAKHNEGLIILSGCLNGPVCHELRHNNFSSKNKYRPGAIEYARRFYEVFKDNYYIELQMPGIPGDVELMAQLIAIADRYKIKTVLSNDSHYIERRDYELQKIMMAIDQDTTVDDPELFHVNSNEQFFKTRAELRATFNTGGYSELIDSSAFERSCDATLEIADKCEGFKPNLEPKLPRIDNAENELIRLAMEGLRQKGLDKDNKQYLTMDGVEVTYKEQMKIELERFIDKGYASYFLITKDLIKCSTDRGWPIGPARGSCGGSLVCFLIGIHSLDPIKWGLSFNRFLSPARGGKALNVMMPKKTA